FDKVAAPPVMVDSIARVMAWKFAMHFRDPNATTLLTSQGGGTSRYAAGTQVTTGVVSGHREVGKTSCPGTNLYTQLATIRALTASYLGTTMFSPRASSTTAVYGTGGAITTTARVNTDQQWRLEVREVCRDTVVRTLIGTATPTVPVSAFWDLRDESGAEVRPGAYTVSLVGADVSASTYTWTTTVIVSAARTTPPPVGAAAAPGRTSFVPVDPIKVYDTRDGANLPLGAWQRVDLVVAGAGRLPEAGIGAVALNISASCATASTAVTAWPAGDRRPGSAALNVPAGAAASALAVTALGGNGEVSLLNRAGTTELAVHVVGYYPLEGGEVFRPTSPLRLYDSRQDPAGPLVAGAERRVTMPTLSGVPASSMTGALLNVTAQAPRGAGALTVQSVSSFRDSATVSFSPARSVKNRAVAKLENGVFKITAREATTHVVVDLAGWWAPAGVVAGRLFQPRAAARVLDTRSGVGVRAGRVGAGEVVTVKVAGHGKPVPAGARAVVMTLTARDATRSTYVTAWPSGKARPEFPDISVPALRATANLVVIRIGTRNRVKVTNGAGATHLVGDVVGYYP
ncbi:MAG: hypothetical protein H0U35_03620, partial [Sporichthyaceae bacterium]|nr:hypothetical protein [Sporichthyaceae bacterium]